MASGPQNLQNPGFQFLSLTLGLLLNLCQPRSRAINNSDCGRLTTVDWASWFVVAFSPSKIQNRQIHEFYILLKFTTDQQIRDFAHIYPSRFCGYFMSSRLSCLIRSTSHLEWVPPTEGRERWPP